MATILDGTLMRLTLDGDMVLHTTSCSLSMSAATRDTASKDIPAGWADAEIGQKSWTASCEGLFTFDGTIDGGGVRLDPAAIFDLFDAGAKIAFEMLTGTAGDTKWSGNVIFNQNDSTFPNNDNATYSLSFTGAGPLTSAVIV